MKKFGESISKHTLDNGMILETYVSTNPFGEIYVISTIHDEMISGLVINDNKDSIECKNRITTIVKVGKDERPTIPTDQ